MLPHHLAAQWILVVGRAARVCKLGPAERPLRAQGRVGNPQQHLTGKCESVHDAMRAAAQRTTAETSNAMLDSEVRVRPVCGAPPTTFT